MVIPCFNQGEYLDEAIESVLNQTCPVSEIIVVDDGSTDASTEEVLHGYIGSGITVIRTENGGPAAARNTGINASTGNYILSLDGDDKFEPSFVRKALAILDSDPGIGVVTCWYQAFGARSDVRRPPGGDITSFLIRNCCAASALFRKQCWEQVDGYDEAIRDGYEDWDFWISVTERGWLVHALPEVLLRYRVLPGSRFVSSAPKHIQHVAQILRKHRTSYQVHVEEVLCGKERLLIEKDEIIEGLAKSPRYRLGSAIFAALRPLKPLARMLGLRKGEKS